MGNSNLSWLTEKKKICSSMKSNNIRSSLLEERKVIIFEFNLTMKPQSANKRCLPSQIVTPFPEKPMLQ